jgi:hypothetical protein
LAPVGRNLSLTFLLARSQYGSIVGRRFGGLVLDFSNI